MAYQKKQRNTQRRDDSTNMIFFRDRFDGSAEHRTRKRHNEGHQASRDGNCNLLSRRPVLRPGWVVWSIEVDEITSCGFDFTAVLGRLRLRLRLRLLFRLCSIFLNVCACAEARRITGVLQTDWKVFTLMDVLRVWQVASLEGHDHLN